MIDSTIFGLAQLMNSNLTHSIIDYIKLNKTNILQYQDDVKNTIFHKCVIKRNIELLQFIKGYAQVYPKQDLVRVVNKLNLDQFSSLHLSSYYGCMEITEILLELGADQTIKSGSGLLPIHAAAQGDRVAIIVLQYHNFFFLFNKYQKFWLNRGINIDIQDNKLNTCLHWAAYQDCEFSINFLISWGASIDMQNDQGETALHLGAQQSNYKVVRKLLVRGADKNIKDQSQQSALDIAQQNQQEQIIKMLEDKDDLAVILNLKQPYRPQKRGIKSVVIFLLIFVFLTSFTLYFANSLDRVIFTFKLMISVFTLVSFLTVCGSDPGYIYKTIDEDQSLLVDKIQPSLICADCKIIKPSRSRHCEICKECVMVYDHHCPWINNCVGAKNLKKFYTFIFLLSLDELISIVILIICMSFPQYLQDFFSAQNRIHDESGKVLFSGALILVVFIPLFNLFIFQTQNLLLGKTTYERMKTKDKQSRSILQMEENISLNDSVNSRISLQLEESKNNQHSYKLQNCKEMCCNDYE